MKNQYFSSPYKLNLKLRNIEMHNRSLSKNLDIQYYNNIAESIPLLIDKFCYLKNKVRMYRDSFSKIPLLKINDETSNNYNPLLSFKSPNKINNDRYINNATDFTTPKIKKYIPFINNKKNNHEKYNFVSNNKNKNFKKHHRNNTSLANEDNIGLLFTFKNNNFEEKGNKKKKK